LLLEFFIIQFSFSFVLRVEGHEHSIHFTPEIGGSPVRTCFCGLCNGYEYNIEQIEIQVFFSLIAAASSATGHTEHGQKFFLYFSITLP